MSAYSEYFLKSSSSVIQYELVELSHPNFTQTFYIVRNNRDGLTVTLENAQSQAFVYYPLRITPANTSDNLDQIFKFEIGDLGELVPQQIDAISAASGFNTKPVCKYRTYRSDDLSTPLLGPVTLEVTTFVFTRDGAAFEAKAPSLNLTRTGELYTLERFPMLRGFL